MIRPARAGQRVVRRSVLGDPARDDQRLTTLLDRLRRSARPPGSTSWSHGLRDHDQLSATFDNVHPMLRAAARRARAGGYPGGMDTTRPGPVRWVRYAYGARLPDRYREWVLRDATDRGWLLRFALRMVAQTLPWLVVVFGVLTLFTPLPVGYVLGALAIALGLSLFFTLTSADELTEARLVKHGFAPGTGKERRKARDVSSW